jgi:hypothetical protein
MATTRSGCPGLLGLGAACKVKPEVDMDVDIRPGTGNLRNEVRFFNKVNEEGESTFCLQSCAPAVH